MRAHVYLIRRKREYKVNIQWKYISIITEEDDDVFIQHTILVFRG